MTIRRLDPLLVDRIAAGEVIERPAAAVKELVENALDAGARAVEVAIEAGGRRLIRVSDDGRGMDAHDLALSVERHATSKIPDGDLTAIASFGFRGEALPSIASVSRLEIRTRSEGAATALRLVVEDGAKAEVEPCAGLVGTRVEARDLFAATPARLKFLKADRTEALAVADVVRRLALGCPQVRFSFATDIGSPFDWPACAASEASLSERLAQALGKEFAENSLDLEAAARACGSSAGSGYRPIRGRTRSSNIASSTAGRCATRRSSGALRAAFLDVLPAPRHAVAALFVEIEPEAVDVNVHPAKAEVRFRDAGLVRGLVVGAIRERLAAALHRASTTGGTATVHALRPQGARPAQNWDWRASPAAPFASGAAAAGLAEAPQARFLGFEPAVRADVRPEQRLLPPTRRIRSARRGRRRTMPISSPRRRTGSSSSTSTRPMSGSSTRP